ncbi:MAG: hypothetical protein IPN90_04750 [Elusimicrobia bacterium]|nr:hypothetical protein [Elusimicrobiota bacterium]
MIDFFLRRPVVTNLITLFLLVVGGYQFFHVRREAFRKSILTLWSSPPFIPGLAGGSGAVGHDQN